MTLERSCQSGGESPFRILFRENHTCSNIMTRNCFILQCSCASSWKPCWSLRINVIHCLGVNCWNASILSCQGEFHQIILLTGQNSSKCVIDSSCWPHIKQLGFGICMKRLNFSDVGSKLWDTLHNSSLCLLWISASQIYFQMVTSSIDCVSVLPPLICIFNWEFPWRRGIPYWSVLLHLNYRSIHD